MTLWILMLLVIGIGSLMYLLEKAPFISADVKPIIRWIGLVLIVVILLDFMGIWTLLRSYSIRK